MQEPRNSEEYKKAYERVDKICRYSPELLKGMTMPNDNQPVQKLAFEDRITEHQIEQDGMKRLSRRTMFKKYGSKLARYNTSRSKEQTKER